MYEGKERQSKVTSKVKLGKSTLLHLMQRKAVFFIVFSFEIRFSKGKIMCIFPDFETRRFSPNFATKTAIPRARAPFPLSLTPFRRSAGPRDGPVADGRKGVRERGKV